MGDFCENLGVAVIARDDDVHGQTVTVAARIQDSALPHQIVISNSVANADDHQGSWKQPFVVVCKRPKAGIYFGN